MASAGSGAFSAPMAGVSAAFFSSFFLPHAAASDRIINPENTNNNVFFMVHTPFGTPRAPSFKVRRR
jgi:hypothetical protein